MDPCPGSGQGGQKGKVGRWASNKLKEKSLLKVVAEYEIIQYNTVGLK